MNVYPPSLVLLILAPPAHKMCFHKHNPSFLKSEALGSANWRIISEHTDPLQVKETEPYSGLDTHNNIIILLFTWSSELNYRNKRHILKCESAGTPPKPTKSQYSERTVASVSITKCVKAHKGKE